VNRESDGQQPEGQQVLNSRARAGPAFRSVVGRWVVLRPVLASDYETLYGWASDLADLYLWSHDRRVLVYQDFVARLEANLRQSQSYLVVERTRDLPIGFCQAYDLNSTEGWVSFLTYVVPEFRRRPHPAEAALILLDILFKYFPIRKVYADVFEYNTDSYDILTSHGMFREEARLPNHIWYEDRFWAVIKLALYREQYRQGREAGFAKVLQLQHARNSLLDLKSQA
jgi:RimJ/RimL family protein N-acetyltransferase